MSNATRRCFTVEGSGHFPLDMLRYDACWPYTETDDTPGLLPDHGRRGKRRVVLQTDNPHAPTVGRWDSFNWTVVARFEARDPKEGAI